MAQNSKHSTSPEKDWPCLLLSQTAVLQPSRRSSGRSNHSPPTAFSLARSAMELQQQGCCFKSGRTEHPIELRMQKWTKEKRASDRTHSAGKPAVRWRRRRERKKNPRGGSFGLPCSAPFTLKGEGCHRRGEREKEKKYFLFYKERK